jgi:predicted dehydrogenase
VRHVALIGAGRWARIIAGLLLDVTPAAFRITVHPSRRYDDLDTWIASRHTSRLDQRTGLPADRDGLDAAIVVNRAHDHARAAAHLLALGVPELVEKPLATNADAAAGLVRLAAQRAVFLGVSRVFLFARYLDAFAHEVARRGGAIEGRIAWSDPVAESRHGFPKRFDPSVPALIDLLPHVLPIVRRVSPSRIALLEALPARGGLRTDLRLAAGDAGWHVTLTRRAPARERVFEVRTQSGWVRLDASEEPGRILADDTERTGDPDWDRRPRPLERMLQSFLQCASGTTVDDRLSASQAVDEIGLADRALVQYRARQAAWLLTEAGGAPDAEVACARSEIAAADEAGFGLP